MNRVGGVAVLAVAAGVVAVLLPGGIGGGGDAGGVS